MFGKYIRNIIATSLFEEVINCRNCIKHGGGFHNYELCEEHKFHITLHNALTSINK